MNLNLRSLRTLWGFEAEFVTDAYLDDIICVIYFIWMFFVFLFENIINYIHYIFRLYISFIYIDVICIYLYI